MKGDAVTKLPATNPETIQELSAPEGSKRKIIRGRKTFRIITIDHVANALTQYLRGLSMIEDNEHVEHFFRVPEGFEIKIGTESAVKIGVIND